MVHRTRNRSGESYEDDAERTPLLRNGSFRSVSVKKATKKNVQFSMSENRQKEKGSELPYKDYDVAKQL